MKLILALSGALLLAGCSSLPTQVAADDGSRMVCDKEQMARVQARSLSYTSKVDIIWTSCPQIRRDQVKTVS